MIISRVPTKGLAQVKIISGLCNKALAHTISILTSPRSGAKQVLANETATHVGLLQSTINDTGSKQAMVQG